MAGLQVYSTATINNLEIFGLDYSELSPWLVTVKACSEEFNIKIRKNVT